MSQDKVECKRLRVVLFAAFAWLFVAGLLVLGFSPNLKESQSRWLVLLAFGPPLYALGEVFFDWLFSPQHGKAISPRDFSVARVFVTLPVVIVVVAVCWLSSLLFAKG